MGPRIREDTGGGGFLAAFSRGWDQCGDDGGDGLRESEGPCNEILRLRSLEWHGGLLGMGTGMGRGAT